MSLDSILAVVNTVTLYVNTYAIGPVLHHVNYVVKYESYVETLRKKVEVLKSAQVRVQHSVDDASNNGKIIEEDVIKWLSDVEATSERLERVLVNVEGPTKKCFFGLCPNIKTLYKRGKKANKETMAVAELLKERNEFTTISHRAAPQGKEGISVRGYEAMQSRTPVLKQIMNALTTAEVTLVGVYGMGGMGKTTLVKEVARQAKKDKLFDMIVIATITQVPDIRKIQGQIADQLGLKFEEESEWGRADRLRQRLKQEQKILVILDDLWKRLDLEAVGIPLSDEHKGCKMLLTSRELDVLSSGMDVQKKFPISALSEEEAWYLFKKVAGDDVEHPSLQSMAMEVVKKCAGLPVAILTVARALKGKSLSQWKNALRELKRPSPRNFIGVQEEVYAAIELSYNHLESKELKSTFLLCSRMGFNASTRDLLKYGVGLGLFSDIVTLEEAQDRVHSLVHKLKASGLLLDSCTSKCFSMHDVVRDVAISIACRDFHVIFESGDGEPKWPNKKTLTKCTEIWLSSNAFELPKEVVCPKLKLLNINNEAPSLDIADNFFRGMQKLKVLGLTNFSFLSLPSSLPYLKNLKALCFDKSSLQEIAVIGELKKLEILSFVKSSIKHLPRQIGQLTMLRLLDLTDCSELELIPPNVISSLSLLEELCMVNSFHHWDTEGKHNASLVELEHLSHLTNLEIHVPDSQVLSKDMFSRRLERYKVLIGDVWDWDGAYETSRTLKLKINTSANHLEHGVLMLLKRTEDLYLLELKGVKNVISELDMEGFPLLQHLHLHDSPEIQYIVSMGDKVPTDVFPMLESLALHNLVSLENICHGALREQSFSKLRSIEVVNCAKLKHLFSFSAAQGLLQLQTINVSYCLSMEAIVAVENETVDVKEFAQLCSLSLRDLPRLQNFCSKEKTSFLCQAQSKPLPTSVGETSTEISEYELRNPLQLFHGKVVFPNLKDLELHSINVEKVWHGQLPPTNAFSVQNLRSLVVNDCDNLKYLFSSSMVKSLVLLEHLTVLNCKSIEEIIVLDDGLKEEETESKMLLHKLEDIELSDLPLLTRFCTGDLIECPSLKRLCISACPEFKNFISSFTSANMTVGIEPPELYSRENCQNSAHPLFDEKVAFPSLAEITISSVENLEKLWHNHLATGSFCELRSVIISNCKKLANIFPPVLLRRFKMLEKLNISHCHTLEQIFDLHDLSIEEIHASDAFQLRDLSLVGLCKLQHIWNKDPQGICNFHSLHAVWVSKCDVLKTLFPFSIARELMQLEKLKIECCEELEGIVAKVEDDGAAHNFVFPQLISLKLEELPKFRNFCQGKQTWECPKLKSLAVSDCSSVMLFGSKFGNSPQVQGEIQLDIQIQPPLFFVEKVISNLEELSLGGKDTTASFIWSYELPSESYSMLKVLKLHHFGFKSEPISFCFLQRLRNLETLSVTHSSFKKLFSYGGHSSFKNTIWFKGVAADKEGHAGMLAQLKILVIHSVHDIRHLWKQDNLLFPVLQNLGTLKIDDCQSLSKLEPSSVSFQNLTTLDVRSCNDLLILIASSTAKSLAQLVKLMVADCKMVTEIVGTQGDEINDEITFSKLEYLELLDLQNLTSFYHGKRTLKFPSLKEMVVQTCPKMRIFSPGVLSTPKLQGVCWKKYSKDKVRWQGDLDTTVQQLHTEMVGFDGVKTLKLSDFPQLKERWHGQHPSNFFSSLIELVADECAFSKALSSTLLHVLKNLQKLQLIKCDLQEAFDLEGLSDEEGRVGLLDLNELHLIDLPRLRHIWNKDSQGILDFGNLNFLEVNGCGNLRNIFTPSMALSLVQLKKVVIRNCAAMEEIITKETAAEAKMNHIIFPVLKGIILESLPSLTNIYSGSGILNLTSLEEISIDNCPCMKVFISSILREPEPNPVDEGKEQTLSKGDQDISIVPLLNCKVSLQNLKRLRVDWNHITDVMQHGQFQAEFLYKLNALELVHFPARDVFPFRFLQDFTNLENVVLSDASFEEIFLHEETSGVENDNQFLARLKELELSKLPKLIHLSKRDSHPCQIFQNLETLKVSECGRLKILVPSSIGFHCLMSLEVSKCHGLMALLTSSTVRNLVQLTSMSIAECKRIEEIISNEEDKAEDMVIFHKLERLRLHCLPRLEGFYLQNTALMFPSLKKVFLNECPKMNFFSRGVINTPKLERVQLAEGDNIGYWENDLNLTVQKLFKKMGAHSELPSSSNQPILGSEASMEDENRMWVVPEEPGSEDLHLNDNPDASRDLPPTTKTNAQHIIEEKTIENASVEPELTELASADQDSLATSNDKVESSSASADIEMISPQVQKNSQANYEDHFVPGGLNKERGAIPIPPAFGVEQSVVSTSASPTKATTAPKLAPHTASRPSSETPSLPLTEIESLFAVMEHLVSPCPVTSSQPSSSANSCAESCESTGGSFETYGYSMDLVKKILTKPLTEVARSPDGLLLLATLKNLKNCHLLNSQQLEIIQDYIENFDLLVANNPLYEHQIERTSSLKFSIEDKKKGISDLKNRYEGLVRNVRTLSAEKEALKKRLGEIQEEENNIQEDAEDLHAQLVTWKEELETHVKALPEAVRQQNEAKHRASCANDNWAKIRSLFM